MAFETSIDRAGRVVLPKPLRDELHLVGGSRLRLELRGASVLLTPQEDEGQVHEVRGLLVARGSVSGSLPDHRELRESRVRRHGTRRTP